MIANKRRLLESFLGEGSPLSDNNDILFYCPNKRHSKPKLSVSLTCNSDNSWGRYQCWVCGSDFKGGHLLSLLKRINRFDLVNTYIEDIKNSRWMNLASTTDEIKIETEVKLPDEFIPLSSVLLNTQYNKRLYYQLKNAIEYLTTERLLSKTDIILNNIGISTDKKYYGYLIIPSFDANGELNYFTGRSYLGWDIRYKNCKKSVRKRIDIIYNEINIDWTKPLLLVEGPFDVMRAQTNATCLLGSTLSKYSRLFQEIIKRETPIHLALDSDKVGRTKALSIANLLTEYNIDTTIINIGSDYNDIAEMPDNVWLKRYKEQLANSKPAQKIDILTRKIEEII